MAIHHHIPSRDITGVILAGGRGQRMGGLDKGLIEINHKPLAAHVLAALRPQVGAVVISANRHQERYAALGCPVISDSVGEYYGPLAGMASAMQFVTTPYILTAPCDAPLLPSDYAQRMSAALSRADAEVCLAHDGTRQQPVYALLRRAMLPELLAYLERGERATWRWFAQRRLASADFSDQAEVFMNVNTPEERAALEANMAARPC